MSYHHLFTENRSYYPIMAISNPELNQFLNTYRYASVEFASLLVPSIFHFVALSFWKRTSHLCCQERVLERLFLPVPKSSCTNMKPFSHVFATSLNNVIHFWYNRFFPLYSKQKWDELSKLADPKLKLRILNFVLWTSDFNNGGVENWHVKSDQQENYNKEIRY